MASDVPASIELFLRVVERIEALGPVAFIGYVGVYVAGTVALVPGSVLAMVAGALFGVAHGVGVSFVGAVLGSSAAFVVARHGGRRGASWLVARRSTRSRLLASLGGIDRSIGRRGLTLVFLLRLSPFLPYNVLNYALGLTGVRFRDYLAGSAGLLPGLLFFVIAGDLAGDVAAAAAGREAGDGVPLLILVPGVLATIAAFWLLGRYARQELERLAQE